MARLNPLMAPPTSLPMVRSFFVPKISTTITTTTASCQRLGKCMTAPPSFVAPAEMIRHRFGRRAELGLQPERNGAVVRQRDLHHGAELPACARHTGCGDGRDELVEQGGTELGRCGTREARSKATARVGRERELGNQQDTTARVAHGAIHLPRGVGKDAIGDETCRQLSGFSRAVGAFDSHQNEQSQPNLCDISTFDSHTRPTYALNQPYHDYHLL